MKLGQRAESLAGLERELLNELDTLPEQLDKAGRGTEAKRTQPESKEKARAVECPNPPAPPTPAEKPGSSEGFLF